MKENITIIATMKIKAEVSTIKKYLSFLTNCSSKYII